jgi:hypothetical protein
MLKILGKYNIKNFPQVQKNVLFLFSENGEKEFSRLCLVIHHDKLGIAFYQQ